MNNKYNTKPVYWEKAKKYLIKHDYILKKVIQDIVDNTSNKNLDSSEISETYLSLVDGLWQKILFDRKNYSNEFCKNLTYQYFKSIFPNENILENK